MQNTFGPRERMQLESIDVLSDTEVVMALLGTGTARRRVARVARSVVNKLVRYQPVTFDGLISIEGVGPAAAGRIMAAFAMAARFRHQVPLGQRWKVIPPVEGLCYAMISFYDSNRKEGASFVRASSSLERLAAECLRAAHDAGAHGLRVHASSHLRDLMSLLRNGAGNSLQVTGSPKERVSQ